MTTDLHESPNTIKKKNVIIQQNMSTDIHYLSTYHVYFNIISYLKSKYHDYIDIPKILILINYQPNRITNKN